MSAILHQLSYEATQLRASHFASQRSRQSQHNWQKLEPLMEWTEDAKPKFIFCLFCNSLFTSLVTLQSTSFQMWLVTSHKSGFKDSLVSVVANWRASSQLASCEHFLSLCYHMLDCSVCSTVILQHYCCPDYLEWNSCGSQVVCWETNFVSLISFFLILRLQQFLLIFTEPTSKLSNFFLHELQEAWKETPRLHPSLNCFMLQWKSGKLASLWAYWTK